ncbi:restriction endonuclease subunit S [Micromonospora sp. WMMD1120]|uniref:restriction endonuclease subunit S n=1 Tax=Micromonospora sp. WMMD1120 TaxID=3016106 RepID=UPI002417061F|nr:restriction endonuclease subunit S [Micromonospora sp. WMMD1120]MDG4810604.1 restriction endonuclease subunit S [Micromonospora sp. WMMD1120]
MIFAEFQELFAAPLRNGVSYPSATRGSGVPMVNMGEAFKYDVIADQECERVPLSASERQRYLLEEGDLLFVRQSLKFEGAGRCIYIAAGSEPRTWESHLMRVRLDPTRANPRYYYYYFRSALGRELIEPIIHQVAAAGIRGSDLSRLQVPIPRLQDQHIIISVLTALDDKIAVNDRIATTVDQFCAALFENIVARNSIGTIELGEIAAVNTKSVKPITGGSLRYIDIASVGDGRFNWPELTSWDEAPARARRGISPGDTIWSTVRPNRRSRALVLDEDPLLVASTGFAVITPRSVGPAFLYESARRDEFVLYLESVAEGSAYPAVRAEKFLTVPVPIAMDEHRDRFEVLAFQARLRAHAAVRENRVLVELRDRLLPELMSGRLRVRDAEKAVEEAV